MSLNQEEREAIVTYRLEKARKTMEQAKCNLPMHFWELVGLGIVVNIIIALVIDIVFTVLFFLEGFIIYFQFYLSGKMFVESLKQLDIKR